MASLLTNPTMKDYIAFDRQETGIPIPDSIRIERINFFVFSTYAPAPKNTKDEYGIVHLGFMGHFFQISEGQYDYPGWLRLYR
ncbi:hypothetical protein DRW41_08330 [Neobacillus piezotolerans]|uniref:Uncharacterized protein n=1 Tax=Neobacillus piezotolerans TaxID=2259171 RepID=A0A3D8GU46_9BACI|nr:hypothetical protein DRW41_08330 [Neobacillus piezotolerans]